jgi:16S rRNA (cytidine1402-2'-O)-methyltransferase
VVTGRAAGDAADLGDDEVAALVDGAEQRGLSRKDAVVAVALETGLAKRAVYEIAHRRTL